MTNKFLITGKNKFLKTIRKTFFHASNLSRNQSIEFPTDTYRFTKEDAKKVYSIILNGALHHSMGNEVSKLELEFAKYHKARSAFATSSGTAAIELALRALSIKPGDEIIIPAYTLISTAHAVLKVGGIPVFADIDETFTISPSSVESVVTKRTKAIIPVHMYGNPCDMDTLKTVAKKHKLYIIEDCCQAIGALYKDRKVGTLGDAGCYSFSAKKGIHTGEGGMIITSNKIVSRRLDLIKHEVENLHNKNNNGISTLGHMDAMTEMQASLARGILQKLDSLNQKRTTNYNLLKKYIEHPEVKIYKILPGSKPSFSRLVFMVNFEKLKISRESFISSLNDDGIPLKTFYPYPLYSFSLFKKRYDKILKSGFPFTLNNFVLYKNMHLKFVELFCKQQVGISFSPYLTPKHIRYFCKVFNEKLNSIT